MLPEIILATKAGLVLTVYQEQEWLGGTRLHTVAQEQIVGEVNVDVYAEAVGSSNEALAIVSREMERRFDLAELRILCHDLGVNYDNLRGEILSEKVRALVGYLVRRGRFADLLQACKKRRGMVDWEALAGVVAAGRNRPSS